jgi:hypothetical protein
MITTPPISNSTFTAKPRRPRSEDSRQATRNSQPFAPEVYPPRRAPSRFNPTNIHRSENQSPSRLDPCEPAPHPCQKSLSPNSLLASSASWRLDHLRHRGFNFIEVLFAVILLGLGFIMIAGIFPVALKQTTQTANETTAALVARDALRSIQSVADNEGAGASFAQTPMPAVGAMPPSFSGSAAYPGNATYIVTPFSGALLNSFAGNIYYSSDSRYGWVAFYSRIQPTDPFAQAFVIVLQNPNFADLTYPLNPIYQTGNPQPYYNPSSPPTSLNPLPPPIPSNYGGGTTPANPSNVAPAPTAPGGFTINTTGIAPYPVSVSSTPNPSPIVAQLAYSPSTGNSFIFLYNYAFPYASANPVPNAVSGAFVLVTADPGNPGNPPAPPFIVPPRPGNELTGRLLRLGNQLNNSQLPPDVAAPIAANTTPNLPANYLTFILQPGSDLKDISEETVAASNAAGDPQELPVYILGAAPDKSTGYYTGPNQDVAAVSSYIRINTAN